MSDQDYLQRASEIIKTHPYIMLSKTWCPDCQYALKVWDRYGVTDKVHVIQLDKFEDQKESQKLEEAFNQIYGRKWVPIIFFNGEKFGTEEDLQRWESDGTLKQVFESAKLLP